MAFLVFHDRLHNIAGQSIGLSEQPETVAVGLQKVDAPAGANPEPALAVIEQGIDFVVAQTPFLSGNKAVLSFQVQAAFYRIE